MAAASPPGPPRVWTVEGPEGEEIQSPIFGVNDAPALSLADALAAARAATGLSADDEGALLYGSNAIVEKLSALVGPAGLDGLTPDEAGAINVYTQESPVYKVLNTMMREGDRAPLKPWFPYLKLLLSALHKLPSSPGTYYRGVTADIAAQYPKGREIVWWECSSSTASIGALESFMSPGQSRVLFSLDVQRVVDINKFSSFPKEDERLLIAGIPLKVKDTIEIGPNLVMVQMTENLGCPPLIPGFILKQPPPWEIKDPKEIMLDTEEHEDGYRVLIELGNGSFGRVYAGNYQGNAVAIKQIQAASEEMIKEFRKEASITFRLQHRNVAHCYGGNVVPKKRGTGIEFVRLIFEKLEATLHDDLHVSKIEMSASDVHAVILQVAQGLHYLHLNKVIHRDMKPGNVMRNVKGTWKLIDFGLSSQSRSTSMASMGSISGANKGTAGYMAPELYTAAGSAHPSVDTFAFGMLAFETVVRSPPFAGASAPAVGRMVEAGERPELPESHPNLSPVIAMAIKSCWSQKPEHRPDMLLVVTSLMEELRHGEQKQYQAYASPHEKEVGCDKMYTAMFISGNPTDGLLSSSAAGGLLRSCGLETKKLKQVWTDAKKRVQGPAPKANMDLDEFKMACRLATQRGGSFPDAPNQRKLSLVEIFSRNNGSDGADTGDTMATEIAKHKAKDDMRAVAKSLDSQIKSIASTAKTKFARLVEKAFEKDCAPITALIKRISELDERVLDDVEADPVRSAKAICQDTENMVIQAASIRETTVARIETESRTVCTEIEAVTPPEGVVLPQKMQQFFEDFKQEKVNQVNGDKADAVERVETEMSANLEELEKMRARLQKHVDGATLKNAAIAEERARIARMEAAFDFKFAALSAQQKEEAEDRQRQLKTDAAVAACLEDADKQIAMAQMQWAAAAATTFIFLHKSVGKSGKIFKSSEYKLNKAGTVITKVADKTWRGAIANGGSDGKKVQPFERGLHFVNFKIIENDLGDSDGSRSGAWAFGVCRPGIDLNDKASRDFFHREDTWMMFQNNDPFWNVTSIDCVGSGLVIPPRSLNAGESIGLRLDLDNGGTLTLYLDGKPCGTIAEGLVGPLYPCIASKFKGKAIEIQSGLEVTARFKEAEAARQKVDAKAKAERIKVEAADYNAWIAAGKPPPSLFRSIPSGNEYKLHGIGAVITKVADDTCPGAVVDGGPDGKKVPGFVSGIHFMKFKIIDNDLGDFIYSLYVGSWSFGVCKPNINLNDTNKDFIDRDDTWLMSQNNDYTQGSWNVHSIKTCRGDFGYDSIKRKLNPGDSVGLLLDLNNGGTLTLYLDGKPCGTIAEGLVGPLYPCIASNFKGKAVEIQSGREVTARFKETEAARQKAEEEAEAERIKAEAAEYAAWDAAGKPPPSQFRSIPSGNEYKLHGIGAVITKVADNTCPGAVVDGGPDGNRVFGFESGIHFMKFKIIDNDEGDPIYGNFVGSWSFGVCRPGIDLNDTSTIFTDWDETWMVSQNNDPFWNVTCNTCEGSFVNNSIKRGLNPGDSVGLLLDLDNGGTLTLYLDGKPCGTIAEGLVGPLLPCIASNFKGKSVEIQSGLPLPK